MIELLNIDCMEYMKTVPDKYFDLAIVDPPYGIDRNGMNMGNSVFNKDDKKWDCKIPTKEYFNELLNYAFRVSLANDNKKRRDYIIEKALFASINNNNDTNNQQLDYNDDPLGIAVPWEEKYGKKK